MTDDTSKSDRPRRVLIICDLQVATLNSLPDNASRRALVDLIRLLVETIRTYNGTCTRDYNDSIQERRQIQIIWSGLAFQSTDYGDLSEHHKILGSLKRLNRLTNGASKFFVAGEATTDWVIKPYVVDDEGVSKQHPSTPQDVQGEESYTQRSTLTEKVVWRASMLPQFQSDQWQELLQDVTDVTVVGLKTAFAVQSTVQGLWDSFRTLQKVSVIDECVLDDNMDRHRSLMTHMIPLYSEVTSLANWIKEQLIDFPESAAFVESTLQSIELNPQLRYLCDCGRGGHAFIYQQHLLLYHTGWARYPLQHWFTEGGLGGLQNGKSYKCPLGKRVIDYCDEPQFSKYCMYVKGREWLDEKEKLWSLLVDNDLSDLMPKTFLIQRRQWQTQTITEESPSDSGLFFVKDCQKNGGKAVQVVSGLDDAMERVDSDTSFVVQQHIDDPYLSVDGEKCHIKSYFLLIEDGKGEWELRMYKDSFLSISPNKWSMTDLRPETQITVKRTQRVHKDKTHPKFSYWPSAYDSIRNIVCKVVETAISGGKLQSRGNVGTTSSPRKQFEIFSADAIFDTNERPWLIECNFGCVLYDPNINQPLTTIGLRTYQRLYEEQGQAAQVNDHDMIAEAMQIVFDPLESTLTTDEVSKWELIEMNSKK